MSGTLAVRQVDVGTALTDVWRSIILFVPRAIAFIAILVIGWIVARVVRKVIDAALERVGFDRAVERGGIGRALERSRYDASDILAKLGFYAVMLFTLQFAFGVWGPNAISDLIRGIVGWLPRAFVAIVIVVIAAAIANAVRDLLTDALGGLSYGRVLANVTAIFVLALGIIAALNQVGIATTVTTPILVAVLATIAGILIVGVGGGLVKPMQHRLELWLQRATTEQRMMRERGQGFAAGRGDMDRQMADRTGGDQTRVMARGEGNRAMAGASGQQGMGGQGGSGVYQSGSTPGEGGRRSGGGQESQRGGS